MKLNILIPTYNRGTDLVYNLQLLLNYIQKNSLDNVSIILSNNCSTDNTMTVLAQFSLTYPKIIQVYEQSQNIGLENNALFCLEQATADFVMYLGDDDYIDERYLLAILKAIENIKELTCVIPSFVGILPNKQIIPNSGRDIGLSSQLYEKGFSSCRINSHRGHQLSGLVFKREGLLSAYREAGVNNLYPFIFFVAYTALNGKVYHITDYPVKVTQVPQSKKDWGYGEDGLLNDIFDNYKGLHINIFQRTALELTMLYKQPWRFMRYYRGKHRLHNLFVAMRKIILSPNTSTLTSILLPPFFACYLTLRGIKKVMRKL